MGEFPLAVYLVFPRILEFMEPEAALAARATCRETNELIAQNWRVLRSSHPVAHRVFPRATTVRFHPSTLHLVHASAPRLEVADFSRCDLLPRHIPVHAPFLVHLDVSHNILLGDEGLATILDACPRLVFLRAHHAGIAHLPRPKRAHLCLRNLAIHGNPMLREDDPGARAFFDATPALVTLRVDVHFTAARFPETLRGYACGSPRAVPPPSCTEVHLNFAQDLETIPYPGGLRGLVLAHTDQEPESWARFFQVTKSLAKLVLVSCNCPLSILEDVVAACRGLRSLHILDQQDLDAEALLRILSKVQMKLNALVIKDCDFVHLGPDHDPAPLLQAMDRDGAHTLDLGRRPFFCARDATFLQAVLDHLPNLTKLGLAGRQVYLDGPRLLMPRLTRLDLSHARINFGLEGLDRLEVLEATGIADDAAPILDAALGLPRLLACTIGMTYMSRAPLCVEQKSNLARFAAPFLETQHEVFAAVVSAAPRLREVDMRGAKAPEILRVLSELGRASEFSARVLDARGTDVHLPSVLEACRASKQGAWKSVRVTTAFGRVEPDVPFLRLSS